MVGSLDNDEPKVYISSSFQKKYPKNREKGCVNFTEPFRTKDLQTEIIVQSACGFGVILPFSMRRAPSRDSTSVAPPTYISLFGWSARSRVSPSSARSRFQYSGEPYSKCFSLLRLRATVVDLHEYRIPDWRASCQEISFGHAINRIRGVRI